ncbi:Protein of unknown function [Loktanella fryxellensis]|uniref:DUF3047 domain-containing protein n=1 Tax=Loktanella fryxellensis TaxID=245187 RepID=A0A1H8K7C7_9RHOB|nr:DUF3047 domain-containing protein [Loktanella fryxellensis]SEN88873.1 Protein of unknown function [Loktanella fryxellensis]
MSRTRLRTAAAALILLTGPALAGPVSFAGWQEQRLSLFGSNDYTFGDTLEMTSAGSVSIAWGRVAQGDWGARRASWTWDVTTSVPPTDLSRKGGDDRNLAVYFLFVPQAEAAALASADIRALLGRSDVRVLQYAYGGNNPVGSVLPSPYGTPGTGATIVLRQAGTGSHSESVDLSADYARAFDGAPGALIGMAVSGDSDDTKSPVAAAVGGMRVE